MRAIVFIALIAAGCGDNKKTASQDAGIDAVNPEARGACLDRPDQLPRPSATLPCDLLPPGFSSP